MQFQLVKNRHQDKPMKPGHVYLDVGRKTVSYEGWEVYLQPRVFRTTVILAANQDRYCSSWDIFYSVWGEPEDGGPLDATRAVFIAIMYLRRKLAPLGIGIHTRHGYGYALTTSQKFSRQNSESDLLTAA